jgi:TetR/AcrR family transcriptional regulator
MGIAERRERERQERRKGILEAAEKVFLSKGILAASMDEIALLAELSKGTLYLYFTSKEDLYVAVSTESLGALRDLMQEASFGASDGLSALNQIGKAYYRFARRFPERFRMVFLNNAPEFYGNVADETLATKAEYSRACAICLVNAVSRAQEEGVLNPDVPCGTIAQLLWAHTTGIITLFSDSYYEDPDLWSVPAIHEILKTSWTTTLKSFATGQGVTRIQEIDLKSE